MTAIAAAQGQEGAGRLPGLLTVSAQFTRLLQRRNLAVLDVVRGAAPGSRRLFLGPPGTESVSHVLAASCWPQGTGSVGNEYLVLQHGRDVLSPALRRSLPRVIERVDVYGSDDGLVMTAVPDLGRASDARRVKPGLRQVVEALAEWLAALWSESRSAMTPTDLGMDAVDALLANRDHGRTPQPALECLRKARERLADVEVPRTVTHGCLCERHVLLGSDGALGVDDWGLGRVAGDPLRDIGRFAVNLADTRFPEVIEGRSSFAATIRHVLSEAMGQQLGVPPRLWREVLVLSQVELAIEALHRSDPYAMVRLSRAVGALQRPVRAR
jgi:hypothetical protein